MKSKAIASLYEVMSGTDSGADSSESCVNSDLAKRVFTLAYHGRKGSLKHILDENEGIDFSAIVWKRGLNPLHIAAMKGNLGCVEVLCDSRHFDIDKLDELDRTALIWAARNKHFGVYEYLRTRTVLSRMEDVYGIRASRYLYDNNVDDESSPNCSLLEQSFCTEGGNSWLNKDERLSLQTISLRSSPNISNNSTPITNSELSSVDKDSSSPQSMDVMLSSSPLKSPWEDEFAGQSYRFPACDNVSTSFVKSKYQTAVTIRRQDSNVQPNIPDIYSEKTDESCSNESFLAEDDSENLSEPIGHKHKTSWSETIKNMVDWRNKVANGNDPAGLTERLM
jgi:ankyrin repeat protein